MLASHFVFSVVRRFSPLTHDKFKELVDVKYDKKEGNSQSKQSTSSDKSVDESEEVEVINNCKPPGKKKALENRQKRSIMTRNRRLLHKPLRRNRNATRH